MLDTGSDQRFDEFGGQLGIGRSQQLAGLGVDDVVGQDLALEVLGGTTSLSTVDLFMSRTCLAVMRRLLRR